MLRSAIGVAFVLLALAGLIGATWAISRVRHIDAEVARKIVHIGMGLLVLSFPWLFDSPHPVVILAGVAISTLLILRIGRLRTEGPGKVLLGVDRSSLGDIYFPVAVAVLFILAKGNALLYCVPLLVLTLADAVAALIGKRWGRRKYTTAGGYKSYEGSAAFVGVAFVSVFLPLIMWMGFDWHPAALIALTVGLIVAALEAISLSGRDNLYIPFAVFVLLKLCILLPAELLWVRLATLIAVLVSVVILRRRTTLDDAALLGAALTAYAALAVGGWPWIIPPLLVLLAYTRIYPNCYPQGRGAHNIHAVVSVTAGGYISLLLFTATGRVGWYLPYLVSYGAQLAMIGVASLAVTYPNRSLSGLVLRSAIIAGATMALMILAVGYSLGRDVSLLVYATTVMLCFTSATVFAAWQPGIRDCPVDAARWIRQGLIGIVLSLPAIMIVDGER